MYYEERIIDGVLCWRDTPDGEWHEFTPVELTDKIAELEYRLADALDSLEWMGVDIGAE